MRKLLFFDIDGTLIDNESHQVPNSTKEALAKAKEKGHLLVVCTGRCKTIWPKEILDLGFHGIIGGCGTNIYYNNKELLHASIDKKLQREIANDLLKYDIDGVLEGKEKHYFRRDIRIDHVKEIFKTNGEHSSLGQLFIDEEDLDFDKMALWFDQKSDMASFKKKYEKRFDFIERASDFYEIVPKGYSKATGIKYLCDYLEIDLKDTFGFGDSTNDLPMLEVVGTSIAMKSGNPAIFSYVDYVTDGVMQDGIKKAMCKYEII